MSIKIKCTECVYARQDKNASTYTKKRCTQCTQWASCPVCDGCTKRDACKACLCQTNRQSCAPRFSVICPKQALTWAAIECANPNSEYRRSLLNITPNGDRQFHVTWSGCPHGKRR